MIDFGIDLRIGLGRCSSAREPLRRCADWGSPLLGGLGNPAAVGMLWRPAAAAAGTNAAADILLWSETDPADRSQPLRKELGAEQS